MKLVRLYHALTSRPTCSKVHVHKVIKDDGHLAVAEGVQHGLPPEVLVAGVLGGPPPLQAGGQAGDQAAVRLQDGPGVVVVGVGGQAQHLGHGEAHVSRLVLVLGLRLDGGHCGKGVGGTWSLDGQRTQPQGGPFASRPADWASSGDRCSHRS